MTDLAVFDRDTGEILAQAQAALVNFVPEQTKPTVAALDAARKYAQQAKDWRSLRKAVAIEIAVIDRFLREWDKAVRPHGDQKKAISQISEISLVTVPEFEKRVGINDAKASRWRKAMSDRKKFQEQLFGAAYKKAMNGDSKTFSSATNEWYTPPKYLETVRATFGADIDLDPASSHVANKNVQAREIFTENDEGETLPWFGNVFLNPPYGTVDGKSRAGLFCLKAIEEYEAGRVSACVILVNSVHAQSWQQPLYNYPVCFVDHRIQFMDADGQINPNPTFMNIFVYLGRDKSAFAREFSVHGYVMERLRAE